jgi:hypothetical protein
MVKGVSGTQKTRCAKIQVNLFKSLSFLEFWSGI